ncbi:hypothetical protein GIB67_009204 [Kingdonia uniflora]|uniref:MULE transposase domain-containing protein n=1 Tax=Kingdonia uniflora TaxID=39325 RepID=A0A7J7N2G9_9MAGN|nr:hypothetical protein GIB67_009204 [Kingdonia uniflora]
MIGLLFIVGVVLHAVSNDLEVKLMFKHIQEDLIHGYYKVFVEIEETPKIVPILVEESPLQLGYRKVKTKSQKPKVKKVRADYLSEEELDDLTKDYASEEEVKIKEKNVDKVDEEVARWTIKELMRQFENNEFEDLTKDSFFDNVDAQEDYHSSHTSQNGDDVPIMDHIENHEGFANNRDFVIGSSNLYEKKDHEDKKPFLPPQAPESMLKIGMEWPNISECRSFMRNFAITQRSTFRQKKNERNMVMEKIMGSYDKGYALCPELYVQIQKSIPTIFKATLDGFTKGCRPILGLNGYFLNGKYEGQCLSIISLDVNNGLFPIIVFICRSKCQTTWIKFLTLVQRQLTLHPSKLAFIFDRQKGLVEAVSQVLPHSNHRFYFRHMYKNFKQLYSGTYLMTLAWNASKAYKKFVMKENLDKLGIAEPDAKAWLEREPYESCYRSYFDVSTKCEHVTNNFSKLFNNWIFKIRDMPLNKMIEWLNFMQMTLMYERKLKARDWDQNGLVLRAVKMIELLKTYSHHYRLEGFEKD